jgi:hypothetical protein
MDPSRCPPIFKTCIKFLRKGKAWRTPSDLRRMATSLKCQGVADNVYPPYQKKNLSTAKFDKKDVLKLKEPINVVILLVEHENVNIFYFNIMR